MQLEDVSSAEVFPNPNDSLFTVTIGNVKEVTIQIIDARVIRVKEVNSVGDKFNIQAMELSAGFYSINIITDGKMISQKMTIIK